MKSALRLFAFAFIPFTLFGQTPKDTLLAMSDGVKIAFRYSIPPDSQPARGFPAILLVHGYGGSMNDVEIFAKEYRRAGYAVCAYTVRGQGTPPFASEGAFNWFSADREMADCREVLEWMRRNRKIDSTKIGMEGYSQGGLTTWAAMGLRFPIRCAIPVMASPAMAKSVFRNGCFNYFLSGALAITKFNAQIRPGSFLRDTLVRLAEADLFDEAKQAVLGKDLESMIDQSSTPFFAQCGWQDDLFPADEILRHFYRIPAPKKLMLYDANHSTPVNASTATWRTKQSLRFYDYWLKDNSSETIMHSDSMIVLEDSELDQLHSFGIKDSARIEGRTLKPIRLYFHGDNSLQTSPPTADLGYLQFKYYLQNLSNDAQLQLATEPLPNPITITGAQAHLVVNSDARKYQANVMLWDYDPTAFTYKPITRGCYQIRIEGEDGFRRRKVAEYDVSPQLFTIPKNHSLVSFVRFGIAGFPFAKETSEFGHTPYPPQETATDTLFSHADAPSWIDLRIFDPRPTIDPDKVEAPTVISPEVSDFTVFPNPCHSLAEISLGLGVGSNPAVVFNILGEVVRKFRIEDGMMIDVSSLPNGDFFLKIGSCVKRLVVAR